VHDATAGQDPALNIHGQLDVRFEGLHHFIDLLLGSRRAEDMDHSFKDSSQYCTLIIPALPNGLRYWRWGGRGLCLGVGKARSQKNAPKTRRLPPVRYTLC
jgi:hypothetical protein